MLKSFTRVIRPIAREIGLLPGKEQGKHALGDATALKGHRRLFAANEVVIISSEMTTEVMRY